MAAAAAAAGLSWMPVQKAKTRPQMILAPTVHTDKGDQIPGVGVVVDWLRLGGGSTRKSLRGGWMEAAEATTM